MKGIILLLKKLTRLLLSSNDDQRMQSIDSIETYAYGMSKYVVCQKEKIKFNNRRTSSKLARNL